MVVVLLFECSIPLYAKKSVRFLKNGGVECGVESTGRPKRCFEGEASLKCCSLVSETDWGFWEEEAVASSEVDGCEPPSWSFLAFFPG